MVTKGTFTLMRSQYGLVGSWAVWEPAGMVPKSNTSSMKWLNSTDLLNLLDTGFIFVGLNWSSTHGDQTKAGTLAWTNFHSSYKYQHDYKLRFALTETRYWGSYITDLIKHYPEVDSSKVKVYIKQNPKVTTYNVSIFEEEIGHLQVNPVLVAMGGEVYRLLNKYLGSKYRIAQIKHYSSHISKEDYRKEVLDVLDQFK